jgi:hypothetical protein
MGGKFFQRRFENVAQSPLRLDEELTAKSVAAMLDDDKTSALSAVRADCMFSHYIVTYYRIEFSNVELFRAVAVPEVEQLTKEIAVLLRRNRKFCRAARRRIRLDTGDKLQIGQVIPDAEIEQNIRLLHVIIVQQNKGAELNIMFPAGFDASHYTVERSFAGMIYPVLVVKFFRPVDTYTEQKLIIAKEPAPFIIKQNTIGLKGIADLLAGAAILFLQLHRPSEKIHAHQRRLATLPRKTRNSKAQPHIIADKLLQNLVTHSLSAVSELRGPVLVKTISAIYIAVRSRWFD